MKLAWLRGAVAVAEHGSFTRAAEQLGVSQPTVSSAVSSVEEAVGATLFVRTTRSLSLTELGEHLLPAMRAVLDAEADLHRELDRFKHPSRPLLRIGVSPVVDIRLLHTILQPFVSDRPEVDVVFKDCFVGDMEDRLRAGRVDMVVGIGVPVRPGRSRTTLYEEPLCYLPPHHAPWPASTVALKDVCAQRVVYPVEACGLAGALDRLLRDQPVEVYMGRGMTYEVLAEWAELGIGGALLPAAKVPKGIRFPVVLDAQSAPAMLRHEVVWERENRIRPHIAAAVAHFRDRAPSLVAGLAGFEGARAG